MRATESRPRTTARRSTRRSFGARRCSGRCATTLAGRAHQFAVGASSGDFGRHAVSRSQSQPADFTADRGTIATGPYVPRRRTSRCAIATSAFMRATRSRSNDAWTLTLAARYNTARVVNRRSQRQDAALNGTHAFSRLDPADRRQLQPDAVADRVCELQRRHARADADRVDVRRSGRAVQAAERVSRRPSARRRWFRRRSRPARAASGARRRGRAAVYRTDLRDDIQFIASGAGATNAGYFQNVGRTRRQGIELGGTLRVEPVTIALRYNAIDARLSVDVRRREPGQFRGGRERRASSCTPATAFRASRAER